MFIIIILFSAQLLRLTWNNQPLFHSSIRKWGYLKANKSQMEMLINEEISIPSDKEFPLKGIYSMCEKNNQWNEDSTNIKTNPEPKKGKKIESLKKVKKNKPKLFGDEEEIPPGCEFVSLPHPTGSGNVGNPMSKAFLDQLQTGVLSSYSTGLDDQNNTAR